MAVHLNAIGIVVSDMGASLGFYRRLGLDFPDGEGGGHTESVLPGGIRLMLDTEDVMASFDPDFRPPTEAGRISLAFACDTPGALDRLHGELTGAGYDGLREPFDAFWGQRYATVLDPDGNTVDLFAALDG